MADYKKSDYSEDDRNDVLLSLNLNSAFLKCLLCKRVMNNDEEEKEPEEFPACSNCQRLVTTRFQISENSKGKELVISFDAKPKNKQTKINKPPKKFVKRTLKQTTKGVKLHPSFVNKDWKPSGFPDSFYEQFNDFIKTHSGKPEKQEEIPETSAATDFPNWSAFPESLCQQFCEFLGTHGSKPNENPEKANSEKNLLVGNSYSMKMRTSGVFNEGMPIDLSISADKKIEVDRKGSSRKRAEILRGKSDKNWGASIK